MASEKILDISANKLSARGSSPLTQTRARVSHRLKLLAVSRRFRRRTSSVCACRFANTPNIFGFFFENIFAACSKDIPKVS
jgi:hypothetical protein